MAVRNFYATIQNDTHGKPVSTGPVGKDEGFSIRVQQRDNDAIIDALNVNGFVDNFGNLRLEVVNDKGTIIHHFTTTR